MKSTWLRWLVIAFVLTSFPTRPAFSFVAEMPLPVATDIMMSGLSSMPVGVEAGDFDTAAIAESFTQDDTDMIIADFETWTTGSITQDLSAKESILNDSLQLEANLEDHLVFQEERYWTTKRIFGVGALFMATAGTVLTILAFSGAFSGAGSGSGGNTGNGGGGIDPTPASLGLLGLLGAGGEGAGGGGLFAAGAGAGSGSGAGLAGGLGGVPANPEPSTLLLLSLGMAMPFIRRKS